MTYKIKFIFQCLLSSLSRNIVCTTHLYLKQISMTVNVACNTRKNDFAKSAVYSKLQRTFALLSGEHILSSWVPLRYLRHQNCIELSRGVLSSVVCRCGVEEPHRGGLGVLGLSNDEKKYIITLLNTTFPGAGTCNA